MNFKNKPLLVIIFLILFVIWIPTIFFVHLKEYEEDKASSIDALHDVDIGNIF